MNNFAVSLQMVSACYPVFKPAVIDCLFAGLHLTPAGYRIVYDVVLKVIRENWPDQDPETLPFVFPAWVDAPN